MNRFQTFILPFLVMASTSGCAFALQAPTEQEKALAKAKWEKEHKVWDAFTDGDGNFIHPDYRDASAYCKDIQVYGNSAFKDLVGWGWVVSALGATGAGGLTAAAAKASGTRNAGLLAGGAGLGVVIGALGIYMIDMGANGRRSAADAGAALSEKDEAERWKQCTAALKAWGGSNADTAHDAAKTIADALKKNGDSADEKTSDKSSKEKNGSKKGDSTEQPAENATPSSP